MRHGRAIGQSVFDWDGKPNPPLAPEFVPTDEQREAIEHLHGPMLVVAGAGTGKTTVLTQRMARLIESGTAKPHEILAVTYTRNSANDLLKRLAGALKGRDDRAAVREVIDSGVKVGTFHAYCYSVLCQVGKRFELMDDEDLYVLLRRNIEQLRLEHFITAGNLGKFLQDLLNFFRRCSDELRGPADYEAYVAKLDQGTLPLPRVCGSKEMLTDAQILGRCHEIARVFRYVETMLLREGLGTYGDVITRMVQLMEDGSSGPLAQVRAGARFILIDEFQDSNVAQIKLARLLAGKEANVFAVGDPDQAIYRFRGATAGAFDQFLATFGAERVKRVMMTANRRSTVPILKCAHSAIACNPEISNVKLPDGETWKRQPLVHGRTKPEPAPAPPVQVAGWKETEREATFAAEEIERLHKAGRKWSDIAVIYRQHSHRDLLIGQLRERDIPFVVDGLDLLETSDVRDLLAVMRAIELRDPVALVRLASLPCFHVDGAQLRNVLAAAGEDPDVESVLELVPNGGEVITAVTEARHLLHGAKSEALSAIGIARRCFQLPLSENTDAFTAFVERWSRKPQQISGNRTLLEFLEYLEHFTDANGKVCRPDVDEEGTPDTLQMATGAKKEAKEQPDAVRLMTAHTAKGLEFPVVFVIRLYSNSFPSKYREYLVDFPDALRNRENVPEEEDAKKLHEEEELRLFYVAMTRAEDQLVLCAKAGTGKKDPTPAGYLRGMLAQSVGALKDAISYRLLPAGVTIPALHAGTQTQPLILDWISMPPQASSRELRLSASAVENYERCPLRYKLSLDWNLPEEPVAAMQFGSAMHLALMGYFDALQKGKRLDAETVVASFLDEFSKAKIEEKLQREMYEENGRKQLTAFLGSAAAVPHGRVVLIEHKFKYGVDGAVISGRIDRVDEDERGLTIIDYKTGRPKNQDKADESVQLSVYALAMSKQKPVKAVVFQNLEDNSTVVTTRDSAALRKAEGKVVEVARNIADGKFEAKPGFHCAWCAYRMICPAKEVIEVAKRAAMVN